MGLLSQIIWSFRGLGQTREILHEQQGDISIGIKHKGAVHMHEHQNTINSQEVYDQVNTKL